ncbi:MAG: leucine-rich repeat domain-containing protein [Verrucomicrobiota bacterium]
MRKLNRLEDHPASGDSTLRDGWITSKPDSEKKFRVLSAPIKTGAVRAELQWPASGSAGILSLRNGEKGYYLSRDRRGVALRFEDIEVGRFEVPNPKPTETYKMELRMSGQFVTAFLDGKEIIRVDDDLRQDGSNISVTAAILLEDARVRNIEVLTLTTADRGTTASSSTNAGGTITVNPSGSNESAATPADHFETTVKMGEVSITKYVGPGGAVVIPAMINKLPVTTIGKGAFFQNNTLTSVVIPIGVNTIGRQAFRMCRSLVKVVISSTVTKIEAGAFSDTDSLITLTVSDKNPAYIVTADGVLLNRSQTILLCYPKTRSADSYIIPDSVLNIEDWALSGAAFKDVTIPQSVTRIGASAFSECRDLKKVVIPKTVTSIDSGAFTDTSRVTEFIVSDQNSAYMSTAEGVLFNKSQTVLLHYPLGRIADSYVIPKSTSVIGASAFNGARINNIVISSGVVGIENSAFSKCKITGDIVIPRSVKRIASNAFANISSADIIFEGDAPQCGENVFRNSSKAKILYHPGAKGFTSPTWTTSAGDNYPAEVTTTNRATTQKP